VSRSPLVSSGPPIVNQRNEIPPIYLTFEPQYFRALTAPRTYVPGVVVLVLSETSKYFFAPSAE
jgi:hypothetical protein